MAIYARAVGGFVVEVLSTAADITTLYNAGAGWHAAPSGVQTGWTFDGTNYAAPAMSLTARRADLAALRYGKEIAGVYFQAAGASAPSLFATTREDRPNLTAAMVAAGVSLWPASAPWKAADGSFVAMTPTDIQTLAHKVLGYVTACYANEAALSAALAGNLAADITQGWPANT